jgi:signal peptidase I
VALYIIVNSFAFTTFRVDGQSMMPTLRNNQILPVNLLAFVFSPPQVGDIVVVAYEGDESIHIVKRIVGVPGDTVIYQGEEVTLAENQYFVEGDNRAHSTDSRSFGPVDGNYIIGKVVGAK